MNFLLKNKFKILIIFLLVFLPFKFLKAYDNIITHPTIARGAVLFYNETAEKKLSDEQMNWIVEGSIAEDTAPRYLNHFYNPETKKGLDDGIYKGESALDWEQNQDSAKTGDYDEATILENYKNKNYERAYLGVGHILHLIEDMAVPAHVRNDAHPTGDPYEEWVKENGKLYVSWAQKIKIKNPRQAMMELASTTHYNFVSKDSVSNDDIKNCQKRKQKTADGMMYYVYCDHFKLVGLRVSARKQDFIFDDNVHYDYWNRLGRMALNYSVAVLDYFEKEFQKIDLENKEKSEQKKSEQKSSSKTSKWQKFKAKSKEKFQLAKTKLKRGKTALTYKWGDTIIYKEKRKSKKENKDFDLLYTRERERKEFTYENVLRKAIASAERSGADKDIVIASVKVLGYRGWSDNESFFAWQWVEKHSEIIRKEYQPELPKWQGTFAKVKEEAKKKREQNFLNSQKNKIKVLAINNFAEVDKPVKKEFKKEKVILKYVIDGDTIELQNGEKVRYIGIDTPELHQKGGDDDDCLAWVARERNRKLLEGKRITLIKDPASDRDKYNRLLRYVYADGIFVNKVLAKEGLAKSFFCKKEWKNCPPSQDKKRIKEILEAEKDAKENKRGIYSAVCSLEKKEKNKNLAIEKQKKTDKTKKEIKQAPKILPKINNIPDNPVVKRTSFILSGSASPKSKAKEDSNQKQATSTLAQASSTLDEFLPDSSASSTTASGTEIVSQQESGTSTLNQASSTPNYATSTPNQASSTPNQASSTPSTANATSSQEIIATSSAHILISQVQLGGQTSKDEFIELYNPTNKTINLKNYRLSKKSAVGNNYNLLTSLPDFNLLPYHYYLVAHNEYDSETEPDIYYSTTNSIAKNNSIVLYADQGKEILDILACGSASIGEGENAPCPQNGESLLRKKSATSTILSMSFGGEEYFKTKIYDSDDNNFDFLINPVPFPRNSSFIVKATATSATTSQENDNNELDNEDAGDDNIATGTIHFWRFNERGETKTIDQKGGSDIEVQTKNWSQAPWGPLNVYQVKNEELGAEFENDVDDFSASFWYFNKNKDEDGEDVFVFSFASAELSLLFKASNTLTLFVEGENADEEYNFYFNNSTSTWNYFLLTYDPENNQVSLRNQDALIFNQIIQADFQNMEAFAVWGQNSEFYIYKVSIYNYILSQQEFQEKLGNDVLEVNQERIVSM